MNDKKEFYKKVLLLVLPMALQNLINVGIQATDVIMLGKVGETALSASSLAGQAYFVLSVITFGLTSGAAVLTAQYWGKRDMDAIARILGLALRFSLGISILFTLVTFFAPEFVMHLFSKEPDVITEGIRYLRIISLSFTLSCFTMTFLNVLRSIERVMISTFVYAISLCTNIALNSIFIFGLLGCPAMGVAGAALGTLFARIVEVIILSIYIKASHLPFHFHINYLWKKEVVLLKDFIHFAMPVVFNEMLWGLAISTNAAILGHMGKSVVAANSIAGVTRQLAMVVSFGVANATAIMVGKAIGENKMDVAKVFSKRFKNLSIVFGIAGCVVVLIALPICKQFLTLTDQASTYLTFMMIIMSVYCICQSYNTTMIVGVFRAGGDTKYGLKADVFTLWFCAIPLGAVAAFLLNLPVYGVYPILLCDEFIKVGFVTVHFNKWKWLKNITRTSIE
jgi:putative MATE family efflux protein